MIFYRSKFFTFLIEAVNFLTGNQIVLKKDSKILIVFAISKQPMRKFNKQISFNLIEFIDSF